MQNLVYYIVSPAINLVGFFYVHFFRVFTKTCVFINNEQAILMNK